MKIIDIRERTFPISSQIRNSFIDFSTMTLSLVAVLTDEVRDGRPVVGFAFNSNGRYGQGALMKERFAPRLLDADPESLLDDTGLIDPHRAWDVLMTNEKPGGHGERSVAVGVLDMALWDARAKLEERPLFDLLAERYGSGTPDPRVFVYAAGGYYHPGKRLQGLKDELTSYLDRGYTVVKTKIAGASLREDLTRIEAALSVLGEGQLMVDANGRFTGAQAVECLEAIKDYGLYWYEEPVDPLDYEGTRQVAERAGQLPIATGENLFSHWDARNLGLYGGMDPQRDFLQFDCALSYGLVEYLRTLEALGELGWSHDYRFIPHGGHQMSLNIAAGLGLGGNESYPDLFQPFGGFPDGCTVEDGHIRMPELPGIGFEGKSDLAEVCASLLS